MICLIFRIACSVCNNSFKWNWVGVGFCSPTVNAAMTFPFSPLAALPSPSLSFHGGDPAAWWLLVGTELKAEKAGRGVEEHGWRLWVT